MDIVESNVDCATAQATVERRPHLRDLLADAEYELRQAARIFDSLRRLKGDEDGQLARLVARQNCIADRLMDVRKNRIAK